MPYLGEGKKLIEIVNAADKVADANEVVKNVVKSEKVVVGTEGAIVKSKKSSEKQDLLLMKKGGQLILK